MIATCPTREQLEAFSLGKLPDDSIESIAEHLEACPSCEDTVAVFDDRSDTFLGNLHGPTPDDPFADESACHEAVSAAKAVAAEPSVADQSPVEAPAESLGLIGDYQLLAKLGHGGMGTVYRALHTRMRRVVALKVLTTHRRHDPAVVERFGREMEAAGKLSHSNIVTAHDAGEADGMHYLVMELVEGVDLHTLVSQHGPLPVADACEIIRQAALGLQHAHEHGLVHRDLKPSNLMVAVSGQRSAVSSQALAARSDPEAAGNQELTADGCSLTASVKILDLGLARLQGDHVTSEQITATGQIMGTLDYMAPEQADDSHTVDIRSDIYALGCTLYKLLTGEAPFSGASYNALAKKLRGHAEDPPPPIRTARPEVPEPLADLIHGMLAKSPDDRPATPAELAAALEPFCDGCDLPALVAQIDVPAQHDLDAASRAEIAMMLPKPSVRSRGRRWFVAATVAALLLAVLGGLAVLTVRTPHGELVIESKDVDVRVAVSRGGRQVAIVDTRTGKNLRLREGQYGIRLVGATGDCELDRNQITLLRGRKSVAIVRFKRQVARRQSAGVGLSVNGLAVSVSVNSTQWKPGDEIELTCSYKNDSDKPVYVPRWGVTFPALEVARLVDSRVALDAAAASVVEKAMQQMPREPGAANRKWLKDAFVEVLPGQTASITRRGVLDNNGQLRINWPNGVVQTWSLDNGRFRLTAIIESRDNDQVLTRLAREAKFENVWYGKIVSGEVDVTVSGITRATVSAAAVEPTKSIHGVSLQAAMSRLSAKHNVSIVLERDVSADTEVSVATHGLTLEQILHRMLGQVNLAFKVEVDRITIHRLPAAPVAFYRPSGIVALRRSWEAGPFNWKPLRAYPDFFELPLKQAIRLKLINTPGRPTAQLYPTIEVERATGLATEIRSADCAPIPIHLNEEDFDQALSGHLVEKAIAIDRELGECVRYVEYQQAHALTQLGPYEHDASPIASPFDRTDEEPPPLASPFDLGFAGVQTTREIRVDPGRDPVVEAGRAGGVLAVFRLGNIELEPYDPAGMLQLLVPDHPQVGVHDEAARKHGRRYTFRKSPLNLALGSVVDLRFDSKSVAEVQPPSIQVKLAIPPADAHTAAFLAHCSISLRFSDDEYDQMAEAKEITKVVFLPAPAFRELPLAGIETLVSTRLDPGVDPVAEAKRRGAVLAIARATLAKPETDSESADLLKEGHLVRPIR